MKTLLVATAVVLSLAACAPTPPPGDSPRPTSEPDRPEVVETEEPEAPKSIADDVYLRISATAHLAAGGTLDLVLTAYEPTIESATSAAMLDAISAGCTNYGEYRAYLETEPGVEHYYAVSELVVTGDAVADVAALGVMGLGMDAGAGSGSAVFDDTPEECVTRVRGAGTATLYDYFSTANFADKEDALHWQYTGFLDTEGTEAPHVTFDNCTVEYSDHARTIMGGEIDWKLRDEGWRCVVAPYEFE